MKKQSLATAITAAVFLLSLNFAFKNSNAVAAQRTRQIPVVVENFQTGQAEILYRNAQPDEMRGLAITSNTPTGVIRLAVILTNFTDNPSQPFTQAQVRQLVFDSNYPNSLVSRIIANSYGIAGIAGEVFDWVTIDPPKNAQGQPYTGCDGALMARDAAIQKAGAQGFSYYMLIFPSHVLGCDADGFGDIVGTTTGLFGNFSPQNMQHELGHNFGLEHSSFIDYPSNSTISSSACPNPGDPSKCEYGDPGDVMGSGPDVFHAFNRYKLGWLPESDIATVDSATPDQTITLSSLDQSIGIRDIAIPISNASGYSYHVEYRQSDRTLPGVTIRLDRPNQDNLTFHSFLIPGRTDHTNPTQAALTEVGQTFIDSVNRISVTFVSKDSATATVHVTVPSGPIPSIDAVNYGGGKKIVVTGSNFGSDPHLLINGTDISSSINWLAKTDRRIKIKAAIPVLNLKGGQNSIQVMNGSLLSNVYILAL